jgi:hypothetical protein
MDLLVVVSLEDACVCKSAVSAGSEDGKPLVLSLQTVRGGGYKTRSGGAEGVSEGEGAAEGVHLSEVEHAHLLAVGEVGLGELLRVHGLHVGEDLAGKGLVELDDADVAELEVQLVEALFKKKIK